MEDPNMPMALPNDWDAARMLGETLGMLATGCFTLQYIPQAVKNYNRKSCHGFSATGIVIKLVGAAFLMVNAYLTGETSSVVLYGLFNVVQHSVFMLQFATYMNDYKYFLWLLFPFLPYGLGISLPFTIMFTNTIKPGAQILSHLPQLHLCYKLKSTSGCSLQTQHLNMIGGSAGLIMCFLIPPKSVMTYFLYINSMFQAISLYALAVMFDNYRFCLGKSLVSTIDTSKNSDIDDSETVPFILDMSEAKEVEMNPLGLHSRDMDTMDRV